MVTQAEEIQAKDFLKRAEIKTMKKDLQALREVDALKERLKIVNIKTLEEQKAEQAKKLQEAEQAKVAAERFGREEILEKNEGQERVAEKDLKNYATEEERQQMFILESQRLALEKEVDAIDKQKDPALKLEKNKILLGKREWEARLKLIKESETKIDTEENFLIEKARQSNIPEEKKGFEQRRWDIEEERKKIEKKTWEVEKQLETINDQIKQIDKSSEQNVLEKNTLRDKILGMDKSLREIYTVIIAREEEKRRNDAQNQFATKETLSKARAVKNEQVRRQQWAPVSAKKQAENSGYLGKAPEAVRKKIIQSGQTEEQQRTKFLQDVESWSQDKDKKSQPQQLQNQDNIVPPTPSKSQPEIKLVPPIPPVPHKN
jgi:hypothetical protein